MAGTFGEHVRAALKAREMSIRGAARALNYDHAVLSRTLNGKQPPSARLAESLDKLLSADGTITALASSLMADEEDRIRYAVARPTRLDGKAVAALADVLAAQRRLDDAIGAVPMIGPTETQLPIITAMLKEARGPHRDALCHVVAEYVQFAGWLHASARNDVEAVVRLNDALELADEADSGPLAAQALNFKAYVARQQRRPRTYARWFEAAYRTPGAHATQRMGDAAQAAHGYAEVGQRDEARRLLDEAANLADAAADQPPETAYWLTPNFQRFSLGLAHMGLREYRDAADHFRAGLAGLPAEQQGADWSREYRTALAAAEAAA
ncbi:helix-turn-helix transcriptional regulator [Streptomyces sp. NPDC048637]|uniref:helix-turn-helix transcriptional regulator n=1 Tax=Streptomyces sp. NPDC048637 TaxID=3155636 RepID=UPI003433037E